MTVYEGIRNFTLESMAELCAIITIATLMRTKPFVEHSFIEAQRESIREYYIRLLNNEVPETEGEK